MVKIIERHDRMGYQTTCDKCKSIYQFEEEDCKKEYDRPGDYILTMRCPVCHAYTTSMDGTWELINIKE